MRVAIQETGSGYEDEILKCVNTASHEGNIVARGDLLKCIQSSFSSLEVEYGDFGFDKTSPFAYDCFILSSQDCEMAHKILDFTMNQFPGAVRGPKIIMLSNLLSWNGKRYHVPVSSSASEFTSRVPSPRETEVYRVENKFHSCASTTGMPMVLVGIGLVYGGHGFDFHNLFQALWDADPKSENVIFSNSDGKNFVPTVHYKDLAQMVTYLVSNIAPSVFVPATDFCKTPLSSIVSSIATVTKRKIRTSSKDEAMQVLLDSQDGVSCTCPHRQWNMDLRFAESHKLKISLMFPSGLVDNAAEVWREFVSACTNSPCSVLFAGPPSSLKTSMAKRFAEKLGIQFVDRVSSLQYVISAAAAADAEAKAALSAVGGNESVENEESHAVANDITQTLDVSQMNPNQALLIELRRAIAVQLASGDKKKKPVDENLLDLSTVEFSEALLDALPSDLLRQCAKNFLLEDSKCCRNGYVLDLWKVVTDCVDIYEITNTKPDLSDDRIRPSSSLRRQISSLDEESSVVSGSVAASGIASVIASKVPDPVMEKLPRMVIEMKSTSAASLDRVKASFGLDAAAAKIPKDQQAILNDLESKLQEYASLLVDVPTPSKEQDSVEGVDVGADSTIGDGFQSTASVGGAEEGKKEAVAQEAVAPPESEKDKGKSHPVIVELESIGYNTHRIDVSSINGRNEDGTLASDETKDAAIDDVVSGLYETYCIDNGNMTWLLELKARDDEAAAVAAAEAAGNEDVGSEMKEGDAAGDGEVSAEETCSGDVQNDEFGGAPEESEDVAVAPENVDDDGQILGGGGGEMVAPLNAVDDINEKIKNIKPEAKEKLIKKCDEMQQYLVDNVLPHVAEALIKIHREKIEDPVFFMADFLQQRGTDVQETQTTNVLNKYLEALAQAEAMEEAAAAELLAISNNSCDA